MIPSTIDPDHLVTTLRDMRSPLAIAAADEIESLRAQLAKATAVPIKAPGNDQLSNLWNAIVENTKGDGFWIGEILLTTLEREVGFNPAALKDVQS